MKYFVLIICLLDIFSAKKFQRNKNVPTIIMNTPHVHSSIVHKQLGGLGVTQPGYPTPSIHVIHHAKSPEPTVQWGQQQVVHLAQHYEPVVQVAKQYGPAVHVVHQLEKAVPHHIIINTYGSLEKREFQVPVSFDVTLDHLSSYKRIYNANECLLTLLELSQIKLPTEMLNQLVPGMISSHSEMINLNREMLNLPQPQLQYIPNVINSKTAFVQGIDVWSFAPCLTKTCYFTEERSVCIVDPEHNDHQYSGNHTVHNYGNEITFFRFPSRGGMLNLIHNK
jgi:hypothetical protein